MQVGFAVHVVNVESLEAILTERAYEITGVNTDYGRVTDIETSHEPLAVQRVNIAHELLGTGAGGVIDLDSTRHLPHILNAYSHAIFLAIRLQRIVKLHIPFKKLLRNTLLAILKVLDRVNYNIRNSEIGCIADRSSNIMESFYGSVHITEG